MATEKIYLVQVTEDRSGKHFVTRPELRATLEYDMKGLLRALPVGTKATVTVTVHDDADVVTSA